LPIKKIENFIGGEFVPPISGEYLDNFNPATGQAYSLLPDSDERDVQRAVEAAEKAFPSWSQSSLADREGVLLKIASGISDKLEDLAYAESVDNGKPLTLARSVDIPRAAENFRFFATAMTHFHSESHSMGRQAINYTLREPVGVVGCISPWNLPLYLFSWKVAPAIASGNCVVAKPSELTPMTAFLFSQICNEAGLPPGVLNIVHGVGRKAGAAIAAHPGIRAVSFTGGTATGAEIARTSAPMFKKLSLELGGKNASIIFSDCEYKKALEGVLQSSFANQGQICLCGSRIFVERSLYTKFRDDLVSSAKGLLVGDPLQEGVLQGAVISSQHKRKILDCVERAKREGGVILCGGVEAIINGRCREGSFVFPTVIEGLDYDSLTNREEIFGPVVSIMPFDQEDEVVTYANSTDYGLASMIWTKDLSRAHRLAAAMKTGIVWINSWMLRDLRTPFGGMKHSGVGREGGVEVLRFFTEPKNVCVTM
jgi:aminomuconate-semialdehyde/2-hydroxymuconate-6-semialdehyde dehydrogenase